MSIFRLPRLPFSAAFHCVFAVLLLASATANADTLTDFTLNASLENGGTETGTLTLDRTTNQFLPGNLTVVSGGTTYTLSYDRQFVSNNTYYVVFYDQLYYGSRLALPAISTLAGYQGGQIASVTFYSYSSSSFYLGPSQDSIRVQAGTLEPAAPTAVTPEPSSLLLLATGLLGVAGAGKRRFA